MISTFFALTLPPTCRRSSDSAKRLLAFSVALLVINAAPAAHREPPSLPLQHGERLVYRVSWAIVPGAGEIKIDAQRDPAAPDRRLLVTSTTATRRLARMLLPFDARSDAVFDLKTARLLSLHEKNNYRGRNNEHIVTFNYTTRQATHSVLGADARVLPMPEGNPVDLIMGLLETRAWNLGPGEKRDALVLFDDDFYELTIHFARFEEVRTPVGTFKTTVLEPRMDKTAPKGMFRRGSRVRVWIAHDEHRLPVKFEVEFKIGTGTATLESYTPPSTPNSSGGRPTAAGTAAGPPGSHAANPRP
jgi:hypothetical protein